MCCSRRRRSCATERPLQPVILALRRRVGAIRPSNAAQNLAIALILHVATFTHAAGTSRRQSRSGSRIMPMGMTRRGSLDAEKDDVAAKPTVVLRRQCCSVTRSRCVPPLIHSSHWCVPTVPTFRAGFVFGIGCSLFVHGLTEERGTLGTAFRTCGLDCERTGNRTENSWEPTGHSSLRYRHSRRDPCRSR